jgi:hypothetical protein
VTSFILSNFYIVVVAVIVIVRLFVLVRKWVVESRGRSNQTPPPLAGIEDIEAEGAALFAEDDDFSAWSLSVVDAQETIPPVHVPPPLPWQPAIEVQPSPVETTTAAPLVLAEAPPKTAGAGGPFWEKLKDLPPMTQAIILSEILGPPKGLRGSP